MVSILFYGDTYKLRYIIRDFIKNEADKKYVFNGIVTLYPDSLVYMLNYDSTYPNKDIHFDVTANGDEISYTYKGYANTIPIWTPQSENWKNVDYAIVSSEEAELTTTIKNKLLSFAKTIILLPNTRWSGGSTTVIKHAYHVNDKMINYGTQLIEEASVASHIVCEVLSTIRDNIKEVPVFCNVTEISPFPYANYRNVTNNTQDSKPFSNYVTVTSRSNAQNIRYYGNDAKNIGQIIPEANGKAYVHLYAVPGTSCGMLKFFVQMDKEYTIEELQSILKISTVTLSVTEDKKCPLDMLGSVQAELVLPTLEVTSAGSNCFVFTAIYDDIVPLAKYVSGTIDIMEGAE